MKIQLMMRNLFCIALVPAAACVADPDELELADEASGLLGTVSHSGEPQLACPAEFLPLLERAMVMGRAASLTPAFAECIDQAVRVGAVAAPFPSGPYVPSAGDPLSNATKAEQAARVLKSARSVNDLEYNCFETGDFAGSAFIQEVGTNPEVMTFGLPAVRSWLNPGLALPEQFVTNTVWHEAMHQHAYNHDEDRADFSTVDQSIPWIVGGCMQTILTQSAALCGSMTQCGPDAVPIIDSLSAETGQCSCAQDRSFSDFDGDGKPDVLVRAANGALRLLRGNGRGGFIQDGGAVIDSGWNAFTAIVSVGDFDSDGHPDLLARDGNGGMHLARGTGEGAFVQDGAPVVDTGWNRFNAIIPVGDFNGDGNPDLLARDSAGGIHLARGDGAGAFIQDGAPVIDRGWNVFSLIVPVGDFDGDGNPDVLARDTGGSMHLVRGDGRGGFHQDGAPIIDRGWNVFNAVVPVGDFDGDGNADVLARDASGSMHLVRGNGAGAFIQDGAPVIDQGWSSFTAIVGVW